MWDQENVGLEEEVLTVKLQLTEAQSSVTRLQKDLDQLFSDKFGGLDPTGSGVSHDERFSELIKEYEQQCRELRDINDELSSELEVLKGQKSDRKSRGSSGDSTPLVWTEHQPSVIPHSDSDELDVKHSLSSQVRKNLQPDDETALCSLDHVSGPTVSIQTELAVEQLKQKHEQELQQLRIQLETQVNFYERNLELMRQSVEVERKDICQAFKLEISELEEQKLQAEQEVKQLQQAFNRLQLQHGGGGWSSELERRMQRERAELEQNFAREISNLVRRLSVEKDQLEAELKVKMDQEVILLRTQLEEVRSENGALQERLRVLQQEVQNLEDDVTKKRGKLEEMARENERSREEEQQLRKENCRYREEVLDLSSRNLQLSNHNAELSARLHRDQESMFMLQERLAMVLKEQEEEGATVQRGQAAWTQEKHLMQTELSSHKEKLRCLTALEAELSSVTLKVELLEDDKMRLLKEMEDRDDKVEKMHRSLLSLKTEADLLRSELHAVNKEKHGHAQEVTELQRKLQDAENKVQHQSGGEREKMGVLQALLMEEQRKSQQLEETLKLQVQQNSFQISAKQDQYETALSGLQQRREELETKLKGVQMVLQEKVQQLKEQLAKNAKSSRLLKELYVENTHLMAALQVTEQWQKKAEKNNFLLEEKVTSLNKLLKDVVQVALAT